ncbi:MAG: AraC family transcriptional regulator [Sphingobacteriales bacterium]|nr:MAG: AraC family transcriptional regulator [Sphingobacteriales bacterium]
MPLTIKNASDNSIIHQNNYANNSFNTKELVEGTKKISLPHGEGIMTQWYFEGIRMGYSNWKYTDFVSAEWESDLDMVHMNFNLRGKTVTENHKTGTRTTMNSYEHNLYYSNGFSGTIRNEELFSETFMLQFTKDVFLQLIDNIGDAYKRFAENILEGKSAQLSPENMFIDLPLHNAIRSILQCNYPAGLKKLFLHSKCLEILVLQADAYERQQNLKFNKYIKSDYDKERILFARDYLIQHLDLPPSLHELSRIAGINEFKLKRGFKESFNNTVFGYLADYRLEMAKDSLLAVDKSPSQLAFDLGYSSLQHFSSAFKKKFGMSPREVK